MSKKWARPCLSLAGLASTPGCDHTKLYQRNAKFSILCFVQSVKRTPSYWVFSFMHSFFVVLHVEVSNRTCKITNSLVNNYMRVKDKIVFVIYYSIHVFWILLQLLWIFMHWFCVIMISNTILWAVIFNRYLVHLLHFFACISVSV